MPPKIMLVDDEKEIRVIVSKLLSYMGYKVAAITNAFGFFTDILSRKAGLDACYGFEVPINDDSLRLTGELGTASDPLDKDRLIAELRNREQVSEDDITVISDAGVTEDETPGIRVALDMKLVLDYRNQKILSRDNLIGILGSFGIPRC